MSNSLRNPYNSVFHPFDGELTLRVQAIYHDFSKTVMMGLSGSWTTTLQVLNSHTVRLFISYEIFGLFNTYFTIINVKINF